jgi:4-hydroxybenzoyl-CoA thioesterase
MDRDTPGREQTLRFLAAPTDAGYSGSVSGGRVMEWIDKAGYACAVGWSGRYCVTVYVGNVRFTRPVAIGDLVEATARLVYTGRTSMHILVRVRSGSPLGTSLEPATECLMVFVAIGDDGRPTPVPELPDGDVEDLAQKEAAVRRIDVRARISAAMAEQSYTEASTAPRVGCGFSRRPAT